MIRVLEPEAGETGARRGTRQHPRHLSEVRGDAQVVESWAGLIDTTPDTVPVISPVEALPGFFFATGFSGHGFGIGPGAGRLVADLVTGDKPIVDPAPFRYARFFDGSKPRPTTGV